LCHLAIKYNLFLPNHYPQLKVQKLKNAKRKICANFSSNQKIKSSLYLLYTLLGVTSERCPSPRLCAKAHTSRLQRWWVIGNMCEIWSTRDMNPIPPAPEANILPLVLSGRSNFS